MPIPILLLTKSEKNKPNLYFFGICYRHEKSIKLINLYLLAELYHKS